VSSAETAEDDGAGGDLEQVARLAAEAAIAVGAEEAEGWAEHSTDRRIRVFEGEVESLTEASSRGLGVRAFGAGGRSGYAYGTDLSARGVRATAEAAVTAAAVADPDEHAGLPERCGRAEVDGLRAPGFGGWTTERKVDLALEIERAARAHDGVSNVEDTVYSDGEGTAAIANSRGFSASYESTQAWAYASAFAGEGADLMTAIGLGLARDPGDLDPQAIGDEAAQRALALRGARQPESRRCPVVLDAFVAASFLGFIGGMLSADAVQRGRSLFAGREGEEIAAPQLRLDDDGAHPDGLATAPFDGEGSPTRSTPLVEDGRLETFLFDARTARRAGGGRETTANAGRGSYRSPPAVSTTNLVVAPGEEDLDGLVREAADGVYVSEVAGLHSGVNPVSGTFSVGATGRLIEGGELGRPAREMTIASDLVSMLRAVRAVGSQRRWAPFGGSMLAAPVLIAEMAVSGS
jgi:PmbA protein